MPYQTKEAWRANYERTKVKRRENLRKFHKENPEYRRNYTLNYSYGISQDEYNRMYLAQDGKCAICKRHQTELKTRLCVDHDHASGKVRGLLCRRCNLVLGVYENNTKDFSVYLGG